jgi:hypothetical protein
VLLASPVATLGSRFRNSLEQGVAVYPEFVSGSLTCAVVILWSNYGSLYSISQRTLSARLSCD